MGPGVGWQLCFLNGVFVLFQFQYFFLEYRLAICRCYLVHFLYSLTLIHMMDSSVLIFNYLQVQDDMEMEFLYLQYASLLQQKDFLKYYFFFFNHLKFNNVNHHFSPCDFRKRQNYCLHRSVFHRFHWIHLSWAHDLSVNCQVWLFQEVAVIFLIFCCIANKYDQFYVFTKTNNYKDHFLSHLYLALVILNYVIRKIIMFYFQHYLLICWCQE